MSNYTDHGVNLVYRQPTQICIRVIEMLSARYNTVHYFTSYTLHG